MDLTDILVLPCVMGLSQQFSLWSRGPKEEGGHKNSALEKNDEDHLLKMYRNWNSINFSCECLFKDIHCRVTCGTEMILSECS